jgi:hypothetical protein
MEAVWHTEILAHGSAKQNAAVFVIYCSKKPHFFATMYLQSDFKRYIVEEHV